MVKDGPDFVITTPELTRLEQGDNSDSYPKERRIATVHEIHQVLISKTTLRKRKSVFQNNTEALDANGSSGSILSWAKAWL